MQKTCCYFGSCEILLCLVALQDQAHFLGPQSAADCCAVSAVSPAVNHTVWVATGVTLFFSPPSCILTIAGMCVLDCNDDHPTSSALLRFTNHHQG